MLAIKDLLLRYPDGTLALDRVSLALEAGQFVAVVGPSGCGKSTLLRVAAGLLPPTAGVMSRSTDHIGFVFQDPTLLPWRSVRKNVELVGELRGLSRSKRRSAATEAIAKVGLSEFADHRPRALSGGMRMRTSLARTLLTHPELLLLDEPFGSVDEITREKLCDDLQTLFVSGEFAALLVTHSIAEAVYLAGRVLVMTDRPGRLSGEVTVPFAYPRAPEIRYSAEFAEVTAEVHALLQTPAAPEPEAEPPATTTPAPKPQPRKAPAKVKAKR